jgi:DNA-binding NarL/FixJ family response regulator
MGDPETVRVVVVFEHDLVRRGLVTLLEGEAGMEVVGEAHNGAGAFAELRRTAPDVVLVEVPVSPFRPPAPNYRDAAVELPRREWIDQFTYQAQRVVGIAQEEARRLNHDFIGPEHILLGLIREGEGIAAKALESLGIPLENVRQQVEEVIGAGQSPPSGHIAFTSPARQALELSFREAVQLGHNYIDTEHILLGLVREGEGVAAQVLVKLGADLGRVRQQVIQLLSGVSQATESNTWASVLRELKDAFPRVGIVAALSGELSPNLASMALGAGATTYLSTSDPVEKVAVAVRVAANLNKPET